MKNKILIVSKDKNLFDYLVGIAWEEELEIAYAENPLQALDMVDESEIPLVFIDVCHYGNRANELSQELNKKCSAIVVAYISDKTTVKSITDFNFVISRKVDVHDLIASMEQFMRDMPIN